MPESISLCLSMPHLPQIQKEFIQDDPWSSLKHFTAARIALGRTGISVPLAETLRFKLAHAQAKDAVYSTLHTETLLTVLHPFQLPVYELHSKAKNRQKYLQRPDWGRQLNEESVLQLQNEENSNYDIALIIADGLSATAVNRHSEGLLQLLIPVLQSASFRIAPVTLVHQARVAIGDEIGLWLHAKLVVVLIGERPGLSSPDSMGVYLTFQPLVGKTDENRNCISNIRPEGLSYRQAADKLGYLIREILRLQLSGIMVKDKTETSLSSAATNAVG
jgi:ethanolamine ammonia-lyase small subunit